MWRVPNGFVLVSMSSATFSSIEDGITTAGRLVGKELISKANFSDSKNKFINRKLIWRQSIMTL
jgi:hypothetical protein